MKKNILLVAVLALLASCNSGTKKDSDFGTLESLIENGPAVFNLSQKLPEREIVLQDVAEVSYIPLETTDEVLLAQYRTLASMTDELILINNGRGEVITFDVDGKIVAQFNNTGGSGQEYTRTSQICLDNEAKVLYIADDDNARIQVYTLEGKYLRTIRQPYKLTTAYLAKMGDKLLINESYQFIDAAKDTLIQPYMLLNINDGSTSRLNINVTDPNPIIIKQGAFTISFMYDGNAKYGDGYMFFDNSIDTVYYLSGNMELSPILTLSPSMASASFFLSTPYVCDHYLFTRQIAKSVDIPDDLSRLRIKTEDLVYDFATGDYFPYKIVNKDYSGKGFSINVQQTPKNTLTFFLEAGDILDAYDEGKLSGPLKELASTLDADDNPVLMVVKFHEK